MRPREDTATNHSAFVISRYDLQGDLELHCFGGHHLCVLNRATLLSVSDLTKHSRGIKVVKGMGSVVRIPGFKSRKSISLHEETRHGAHPTCSL